MKGVKGNGSNSHNKIKEKKQSKKGQADPTEGNQIQL